MSVHQNLTWHAGKLTEEARLRKLGQRGCAVWFTGLSGSGKSTLARELELALVDNGKNAAVLDGDNIRLGLNRDGKLLKEAGYSEAAAARFGLGFAPEDRTENIRRVGEVAKLFAAHNVIAITAFISPFRADRATARALFPAGQFFEIHCAADLAVCEGRDVKGLYKKARAGQIADFTGVNSPYEPPEKPDLALNTGKETVQECTRRVISLLQERGII